MAEFHTKVHDFHTDLIKQISAAHVKAETFSNVVPSEVADLAGCEPVELTSGATLVFVLAYSDGQVAKHGHAAVFASHCHHFHHVHDVDVPAWSRPTSCLLAAQQDEYKK